MKQKAKTYSEKLRDPRWQKRRLEMLEAAHFECQNCGDKKEELHVHHKRYIKAHDPWEYEDADLVVLCSSCHEQIESKMAEIHKYLAQIEGIEGLDWILGFIKGRLLVNNAGSPIPLGDWCSVEEIWGFQGAVGEPATLIQEFAYPKSLDSMSDFILDYQAQMAELEVSLRRFKNGQKP